MTLQNAFSELSTEETVQSLRLIISALSRSIGLCTPDAAGRMRVSWENANTMTVAGVSTLSNQLLVGGYNANDQIPALMRFSAASLRTNIQIT